LISEEGHNLFRERGWEKVEAGAGGGGGGGLVVLVDGKADVAFFTFVVFSRT